MASSANSHAMVPRHLLEPAGAFTGKRRALAHLVGPDTRHFAGLYPVEDRGFFRRELEGVAVTAGDNDPENEETMIEAGSKGPRPAQKAGR